MNQTTISHRSTVCVICKRTLTDETSIARGYGDDCARKFADRTAFEARFPVGCRVRFTGSTDEGSEGTVVMHRYRSRKPAQLVVRVDGSTWLRTAIESWVVRVDEEGLVAA